MSVRARKRFRITRFLAPLATLLIMGYFAFHSFHGQYGIRADIVMKTEIAHLESVLSARTSQREELDAKVRLLRHGTLERDMVDEQIRRQLNMIRSDEVIFWFDTE